MDSHAERWEKMVRDQERYLNELAADSAKWDPAKLRAVAESLRWVRDTGALLAEHRERVEPHD